LNNYDLVNDFESVGVNDFLSCWGSEDTYTPRYVRELFTKTSEEDEGPTPIDDTPPEPADDTPPDLDSDDEPEEGSDSDPF
jgi:hypothetical protein